MNGEEQSLLSGWERRLHEALGFNLLSERFMAICPKNVSVSEYVLRILIGKEELRVKAVWTQKCLAKLVSHDHDLIRFL